MEDLDKKLKERNESLKKRQEEIKRNKVSGKIERPSLKLVPNKDVMERIKKETDELEAREAQALLTFGENIESTVCKWLQRCHVPSRYIGVNIDDLEEHDNRLAHLGSFYITGKVGCGKTHIAVAIMKRYIYGQDTYYDKHARRYRFSIEVDPIFVVVPELLLDIRSCFDDNTNDVEKEVIEKYAKTPFLILDDIGTEKSSEWALQTLYIIINKRYNEELPTVITSNLSLTELGDTLGDRIISRIGGMCVYVGLEGEDRR